MTIRDVNLVEPGILKRRYLFRHLFRWAVCLMISLTAIGGIYYSQSCVTAARKSDPASLRRLHTDLEARIEEIKQIMKKLETLHRHQTVLRMLIKKQPYYQVLSRLSEIMNEHIWLTRFAAIRLEGGHADSRLKLNGISMSNKKLGELLKRFANEPMFKNAELKYSIESATAPSNRKPGEAGRRVRFLIECKITG
jgi:Tfp pilus assembly protein PilN